MRKTVALVLAGGINLGYSVLTHNRAKSALPFCGHFRIVDFVLTNLSRSGIQNVGIMIQYLPGSLIDHIGIGQAWEYNAASRKLKLMPPFVGMGKTEWFRGSADAIYQNVDFILDNGAEDVLVVCADHIYTKDFRPLIEYHDSVNADLTIMTTTRPPDTDADHYGYVTADSTGRVHDFVEKPSQAPHDVVSTGIYLFDAESLVSRLEEMHRVATNHHLPTTVVEPLVKEGRAFAHHFEEDWHYLPDIESYVAFHYRLLTGRSTINPDREEVMTNLRDRELGSRPAPYFGPLSQVRDSMVSPGCVVEGTVERSVLSPGVVIRPGAVVRDCILFHDCEVQEGAHLDGVVSDKDAVYGAYCRVGKPNPDDPIDLEHPELAKLTIVGKGARVLQAVKVPSGIEIPINQAVTRDWDTETHVIESGAR